ncbi:MAG: cytochrome c oxidase subunit 2A [Chitinophagales bacterium]
MQHDIQKEPFKPKGAIAFFVVLVVLGLIIWFGIYALMLQRG